MVSVYLAAVLGGTWLFYFSPLAGFVGASVAATVTAMVPSCMIVGLLVCSYSDALDRKQVVWSAVIAILWMAPLLMMHVFTAGALAKEKSLTKEYTQRR